MCRTEWCEKGDLNARIEEKKGVLLPEPQILDYFVQLAAAMLYLHKRRLLHRDLKVSESALSTVTNLCLSAFCCERTGYLTSAYSDKQTAVL